MGPRPYRPVREFEHAVERGDLTMAVAIARDIASEHGRPVGLDLALELLPLAAGRRELYEAWALRWLARWASEWPQASIEQAAEVAAALADLPVEPHESMAAIRRACGSERVRAPGSRPAD
jgi:hypothetical protein